MKKIIVTLIGFCLFAFNSSISGLAYSNRKPANISEYVLSLPSAEVIDQQVESEIARLNSSSNGIQPMVTGINYEYVLLRSDTVVKKPIDYAYNQQINGVVFINYPGYIYWIDGGTPENFSLNLGYGPISISVSPGNKSNIVGGYAALCPANIACKLFVYRDLLVSRYAVYKIQYGVRTFAYYVVTSTSTKLYLEGRTNF